MSTNNLTSILISLTAIIISLSAILSKVHTNNQLDNKPNVAAVYTDTVITKSLSKVMDEFKKLSKEDQESYFTQVTGASLFLEKYTHLGNSQDFNNILYGVVRDFGWEREKYPDFSDALESYLKESGYNIPRELSSDEDRLWMYNIFNSLRLALEKTYE